MSNEELLISIIIPLICSLIGAVITILGVLFTIKHENKYNRETIRLSFKPLFYRIDPLQDYERQTILTYQFNFNSQNTGSLIEGIFKNTDNSVIILDRFIHNNKEYFPSYGNVVDKNAMFYLYIRLDELVSDDSYGVLIVKDILENEYKYELRYKPSKNGYSEIIELKELI